MRRLTAREVLCRCEEETHLLAARLPLKVVVELLSEEEAWRFLEALWA
jgi:hypothetical protein